MHAFCDCCENPTDWVHNHVDVDNLIPQFVKSGEINEDNFEQYAEDLQKSLDLDPVQRCYLVEHIRDIINEEKNTVWLVFSNGEDNIGRDIGDITLIGVYTDEKAAELVWEENPTLRFIEGVLLNEGCDLD